MKERKDCNIVQDLLPNYIENLTNDDTNEYIENHLKECNKCKKVLENMKKDYNINNKQKNQKEVKYIKKYSNHMKILKSIILIIILIYFAIILRRTFILCSLGSKATENQKIDNYIVEIYSHNKDILSIIKDFNYDKNTHICTFTQMVSGKEIRKLTNYSKDNEKIAISEVNGKKYYLNPEQTLLDARPITYVNKEIISNFMYSFVIQVKSTYCNGKPCYLIRGDSYERFIDKDTGLAIRDIERSTKDIKRENDLIVDYDYKFNVVKIEDIVKPDTTNLIKNK